MMIRSLKQYAFIYDVLFDALHTHHAVVSDDVNVCYRLLKRVDPHTSHSYFHEQFKVTSNTLIVFLHTYLLWLIITCVQNNRRGWGVLPYVGRLGSGPRLVGRVE